MTGKQANGKLTAGNKTNSSVQPLIKRVVLVSLIVTVISCFFIYTYINSHFFFSPSILYTLSGTLNAPSTLQQIREPPFKTVTDSVEFEKIKHKQDDNTHKDDPRTPQSHSNLETHEIVIQGGLAQDNSTSLQHLQIQKEVTAEHVPSSNDITTLRKINWIERLSKEELASHASRVDTATRNTIELDSLPYLKNFRNPCWIEELPVGSNPYSSKPHRFEMMSFQESRLRVRSQFAKRKADGKPYRMRCLPYYYIIGPQKSGTTDLYNSLIKHPAMVQGMAKEPHWWPRSRLATTTLEEYIDLFDQAAETIATNTLTYGNGSTFHPFVTGDATPELIWDNWQWRKQPENAGEDVHSPELRYIIAHHIHHVTPQAKIIAMLRDPVTRLWSDYNYFGHGWTKSPTDYHKRIQKGLKWLTDCFQKVRMSNDRRHCMYDSVEEYGSKYGGAWNPVVRLRMGMYSEMLIDWFDIFPRENILILKMEDYAKDRVAVVNKLLTFLELDEMPESIAQSLQSKRVENAVSQNTYSRTGQVDEETIQQLRQFYKPYNEKLVELTGNSDFLLWNS